MPSGPRGKGLDIRVDNHTGNYADSYGSEEEYTDDFVSEEEDEDEYTTTDEEESWDLIEEHDEINPSDSASRPHARRGPSHHRAAPPAPVPSAPSAPVTTRPRQSRRASSRHAVAAPDPHSAQHSRSRSRGPELAHRERPRRRHRGQSAHPQPDSLEEDTGDDYPYAGGLPHHGAPGHPSPQWSHVPPAHGYAPSAMSQHDPRFYHHGGAASPAGQLVGQNYYGHDAYHQNGFSPQAPNPFATGPGDYMGARPRNPNRNSMGGPPAAAPDAMMPYGQPPMGHHPGYPQGYGYPGYPMPPMGYPYQHPSPPPQEPRKHKSKRGTPRPPSIHYDSSSDDYSQSAHTSPPPPAQPPMTVALAPAPLPHPPPPPPPPPPPDTSAQDAMIKKLESIISGKAEEDAKKAEAERAAKEAAKFDRLEQLLIAQQEAQIAKDKAKQQAVLDAAKAAAEGKKKADEDKLAKLEKLILAQKDEQLKREAAVEAERKAVAEAADAAAKKEAAEKKAAAEAAKLLLEAATKAREEAEKEAKKKAEEQEAAHKKAQEEAEAAHKKALEDAQKAAEELEKAKKAAEEEAAKLKPSDAPKAPIKFKDAVGRKFSFPWHLCKTWKGMEELIKQAFLHVDIIGPHVHQGHYDLVGPDGEIILPQVWETMIQPDWNITMHMWPMPEPPPEPPKEAPPPPPPPPPPFDAQEFLASHPHAGMRPKMSKSGKSSSKHKVPKHGVMPDPMVVHPPPPPPPAAGQAIPPPPPLTPGVLIVPASSSGTSHKPKKKTAPGGFLAWAAGSNPRSSSLKKSSKKA